MAHSRNTSSTWRLESFLGSASEPILVLTPDRRIAVVNKAWEELTGYSLSEVAGLECRPHGPTLASDLVGLGSSFYPPAAALAGQPAGGKTLIIRRGGERLQRRIEFWPFHDKQGSLRGLFTIVRPAATSPLWIESDQSSLRQSLLETRLRMFARYGHDTLVGLGAAHERVLSGIEAASVAHVPVTIMGEPGTGKRFVARLIHQQGLRRQMPLLGYDCAAIPTEILERELFGPQDDSSPLSEWGRLLAPEGATIVIGDILESQRDFQARLAVGLSQPDRPARLIATTTGSLDDAVRNGRMNPDLYHALSVLTIHLRPLRARNNELPLFAQAFLERANLRGQASRSGFSSAAIATLQRYDWPGNLRELAKVVEDAHQTAQGDLIEHTDLPARIRGEQGGSFLAALPRAQLPLTLPERLNAFERELIEQALGAARQNKTKAAKRLGVNRPFLYRRIRELGILDLDPGAAHSHSFPTSPDPSVPPVPPAATD